MRISTRHASTVGMCALLFACNSVLGIEEAAEISSDQDLSDDQEERNDYDLRDSRSTKTDGGTLARREGDPSCGPNAKLCFDKCVDLADPRFGCGATSCTQCAFAHATRTTCKENACELLECNEEWADCNHEAADGCETDLFSSKSCGACGNVCPASERFCVRGTCSPTAE